MSGAMRVELMLRLARQKRRASWWDRHWEPVLGAVVALAVAGYAFAVLLKILVPA